MFTYGGYDVERYSMKGLHESDVLWIDTVQDEEQK